MPFFHLRGDGFWHLLPKENARLGSQIAYMTRLREEVMGARLDEDLYSLILAKENRDRLRSVLIETYFSPETRRFLVEQSAINLGAFVYSEGLLKRPEDTGIQETLPIEEAYRPTVRDQGFRRPSYWRTVIAAPCVVCAYALPTGVRLSWRLTSYRGVRRGMTGPPTAWRFAGCATGRSMRGCSGSLRATKSSPLGNSTSSIIFPAT